MASVDEVFGFFYANLDWIILAIIVLGVIVIALYVFKFGGVVLRVIWKIVTWPFRMIGRFFKKLFGELNDSVDRVE